MSAIIPNPSCSSCPAILRTASTMTPTSS
jgi:hypothetical protein